MTSKYGFDAYGVGPYSEAPYSYFEGALAITSPTWEGNFLIVKTLYGSFSIATAFLGVPMGRIRGMDGSFDITTDVKDADWIRLRGMGGGFAINTAWIGELYVPHEITLEGVMEIETTWSGRAENQLNSFGGFAIDVTISGEPFIGGFWNDTKPDSGGWSDTTGPASVWQNTEPPSGNWN